jgi:enoyl-CoA hydratase/carnithine racemase
VQEATSAVLTERRGPALWIVIQREERRNALNAEVIGGIADALEVAARTPDVRVIVLTGSGDKAFCAGADLSAGPGVFSGGREQPRTDFAGLLRLARGSRVPLIARVNGACVAGGMGLLAMCDLAVVADHARFGLPEGKVGVFPMQVLVLLRELVPPRSLNELCFTGDLVDAARARELGLANIVVSSAELDGHVESLVQRICACSPLALARGRAAMHTMESMDFDAALDFARSEIAALGASADAAEGLAAFNERRPPAWVGRSEAGTEQPNAESAEEARRTRKKPL